MHLGSLAALYTGLGVLHLPHRVLPDVDEGHVPPPVVSAGLSLIGCNHVGGGGLRDHEGSDPNEDSNDQAQWNGYSQISIQVKEENPHGSFQI